MGSLEAEISASENRLIESLVFEKKPAASYVTMRRNVSWGPTSASAFSPTGGTRTLRFSLGDEQAWLDPRTLALSFRVVNTGSIALQPTSLSAASLFRRLRVLMGGTVVDDIGDYGRVVEVLGHLKTPAQRLAMINRGWGNVTGNTYLSGDPAAEPIGTGESRFVVVYLEGSSILGQHRYINTTTSSLVLELELGDVADAMTAGGGLDWQLDSCRCLADVCHLDNTLANSFHQILQSGKNLPYPTKGLFSTMLAIQSGSTAVTLNIARSFSRVSMVLVSLWDGTAANYIGGFRHPNVAGANSAAADTFSYRFKVGSQMFPEYEPQGVQECLYRLEHALSHSGTGVALGHTYRKTDFIIGQSFEHTGDASLRSGVSTRGGATLQLDLKNPGTSAFAHVIVFYDASVNQSLSGVEILD